MPWHNAGNRRDRRAVTVRRKAAARRAGKTAWRAVGAVDMATVKKGILVRAGEWWKHLRWTKRVFWKRHRKAEQRLAKRETLESCRPHRRQ